MPSLFGTDGVRGVANATLTPEQALSIGRAGACCLMERGAALGEGRPFLVLGRDSRVSGELLASAVTAGCLSVGAHVIDLGILPTPGVAFLTGSLRAIGGVMISASHNPVDDNGIKFFDAAGYKLSRELEEAIEARIRARVDRMPRPTGDGVGRLIDGRRHVRSYADHLLGSIGGEGALSRRDGPVITVVLDAAYGATSGLAADVFRRAGAVVRPINDTPDGLRINVGCGSTNPDAVGRRVVSEKASAGLAFDGDGDRVIAVDETGQVVDGDQIMAVLALDLIARKALPKKTVVATVMSNLGLDVAVRELGGKVRRTAVGDRNVLIEMLQHGAILGGEQSGHIILLRYATTGDGILTGLHLMQVMSRTGARLSELAAKVKKMPQVLINVSAVKKDKLETSEKVATAIERVRESLGHAGRVLVRPSGTEPLVRIMIEGRDARKIETMALELAGVVANELGGEVIREKEA
ncbi:MAG: phosphoglucosamine mutase [Bacillota bacterium]|nr:MAG: phosphoglucosamine mutase [Bacillota bacterium]